MTTGWLSLDNCTSTSTASAPCSQARRTAASVFSGASCDAPRWAMMSILAAKEGRKLFRQPLLPVPGKFIHVFPGHRNERTDIFDAGRVFPEMDFVNEVFDRMIAPVIDLLGEEQLNVAAAEIGKLSRQSVNGDAFHRPGLPFQSVVGEQRPAANALKWQPGTVKCVSVDALPPELAYLRS